MDVVSAVATWVGVILGIASTVLAIVTIVFARATENRSDRLIQQTIASLQKIETTVERLSQDTNGLIKAAWDKMFEATSGAPASAPSPEAIAAIEETLGELRTEIREIKEAKGDGGSDEAIESLRRNVRSLERSLREAQTPSRQVDTSSIGYLVKSLERVSTAGVELVRALLTGGRHLNKQQMADLADSPLAGAVTELRETEILIPLRSPLEDHAVYWFAPGVARSLETALSLVGKQSEGSSRRVRSILRAVGYMADPPKSPENDRGA